MDQVSELLTAQELAKRLPVMPGTVQHWARSGRIPSLRTSHKVIRYDLRAVLAAVAIPTSSTRWPVPDPAHALRAPFLRAAGMVPIAGRSFARGQDPKPPTAV